MTIISFAHNCCSIVSDSKNAEFIHAAQSMLGVSATAHIEPKLSHILKSLVRSYNATKKYSHKKVNLIRVIPVVSLLTLFALQWHWIGGKYARRKHKQNTIKN